MDKDNIQQLLHRFNAGAASPEDQREIEALLEAGIIDLGDLNETSALQDQVSAMWTPDTTALLDRRFYDMLAQQKRDAKPSLLTRFFSWPALAPRLAIASVTLVAGLVAGYLLGAPAAPSHDQQIEALSRQVSELQEMMMLSMLEKGSATERLKAVGLTGEMDEASKKVTGALLRTLNNDENVNVRLAALEALKSYVDDGTVREALVRSIARQESPLVQVSLAELMAALQEKAAVQEFEKIMASEKTPEPVKKKIRESINVLI